jgi:hypothetical protein
MQQGLEIAGLIHGICDACTMKASEVCLAPQFKELSCCDFPRHVLSSVIISVANC